MRKRSEREIERQKHWQEIVQGQQQSGQSVRAYCRAEGLRESAFYFWRRELARRSHRVESVDGLRLGQGPAPSFLPVRVVDGAAREATRVEIFLANGRRVRVPAGFDRQTLADVLAVLEVPPC